MFIDKTKIYVKAGNGGNGAIAFHREKYVAAGAAAGATSISQHRHGRCRALQRRAFRARSMRSFWS